MTSGTTTSVSSVSSSTAALRSRNGFIQTHRVLMATVRPVLRGSMPEASRRSASIARRRFLSTTSRTGLPSSDAQPPSPVSGRASPTPAWYFVFHFSSPPASLSEVFKATQKRALSFPMKFTTR